MSATPSVWIVTPSFNSARFVGLTIKSVVSQTFADWQYVVVDDGSSDDTYRVLRRAAEADSRIRILRQKNQGVAAARNTGLASFRDELSTSGAVMFLDADDLLLPDALGLLTEELKKRPDCAAAYGNATYIDSAGNRIRCGELEELVRARPFVRGQRLTFDATSKSTTFESLAIWNCVTTPGMAVVRGDVLRRMDHFDRTCSPAEDWDFWMRVCREGPLAFVDQTVLEYRQHGGTLSRNRKAMRTARASVVSKAIRDPRNSQAQRQYLEQGFRAGQAHVLASKLSLGWDAALSLRPVQAAREAQMSAAAALRWIRGIPR